MKFTLSYSPYADADLEQSLIFYGMRGENLAQSFLSEIQDATESILGSPLSFPILFKRARKKSLVKFPFQIIYTIDEEKFEISVIAIWHSKRNPDILQSRI